MVINIEKKKRRQTNRLRAWYILEIVITIVEIKQKLSKTEAWYTFASDCILDNLFLAYSLQHTVTILISKVKFNKPIRTGANQHSIYGCTALERVIFEDSTKMQGILIQSNLIITDNNLETSVSTLVIYNNNGIVNKNSVSTHWTETNIFCLRFPVVEWW